MFEGLGREGERRETKSVTNGSHPTRATGRFGSPYPAIWHLRDTLTRENQRLRAWVDGYDISPRCFPSRNYLLSVGKIRPESLSIYRKYVAARWNVSWSNRYGKVMVVFERFGPSYMLSLIVLAVVASSHVVVYEGARYLRLHCRA